MSDTPTLTEQAAALVARLPTEGILQPAELDAIRQLEQDCGITSLAYEQSARRIMNAGNRRTPPDARPDPAALHLTPGESRELTARRRGHLDAEQAIGLLAGWKLAVGWPEPPPGWQMTTREDAAGFVAPDEGEGEQR